MKCRIPKCFSEQLVADSGYCPRHLWMKRRRKDLAIAIGRDAQSRGPEHGYAELMQTAPGPRRSKRSNQSSRGVLLSVTADRGGVLSDPRLTIAYSIRRALRPNPFTATLVTVYDATGRPVATMDPVTRKRTPLP